ARGAVSLQRVGYPGEESRRAHRPRDGGPLLSRRSTEFLLRPLQPARSGTGAAVARPGGLHPHPGEPRPGARGEPIGAAEAAIGLIEGNPIAAAIVQRRADALEEVKQATAAAVAAELGDPPVRIPLHAVVFSARRP